MLFSTLLLVITNSVPAYSFVESCFLNDEQQKSNVPDKISSPSFTDTSEILLLNAVLLLLIRRLEYLTLNKCVKLEGSPLFIGAM